MASLLSQERRWGIFQWSSCKCWGTLLRYSLNEQWTTFNPLTPRDFIKFSTNSWNFFGGIFMPFLFILTNSNPYISWKTKLWSLFFFARKKCFSVAMATLRCLEQDTFVFFVHILKWTCQNYQFSNTKYLSSNPLSHENVLEVSAILLSVYTCLYFGY